MYSKPSQEQKSASVKNGGSVLVNARLSPKYFLEADLIHNFKSKEAAHGYSCLSFGCNNPDLINHNSVLLFLKSKFLFLHAN